MKEVTIYTDGGCISNPGGPGGFAALLRFGRYEKTVRGAHPETTNNQMEIMAAIAGMEALTRPCKVQLYSDSNYLVKGMGGWINGWIKNGWRTQRGPVKNAGLWKRLKAASDQHEVEWLWVKGHSGNPGNDRVDGLATKAREELQAGTCEATFFEVENWEPQPVEAGA